VVKARIAAELVGFILVVGAAATVSAGLGLLVAGVGLIVAANAPEKRPPKT